MILARGPLRAMEPARVSFNDAREPYADVYGDCYFSAENGIAESQHVFLAGSDLGARLRSHLAGPFTVAELGFGTGLNFLLTWRAFEELASPQQRLHYWSVDRHPLAAKDFSAALERWPALAPHSRELLRAYPSPVPGVHRRHFAGGRVTLDLVWADAEDALEELQSLERPMVNAWYLDGFAPDRNTAMWTPELFGLMASASHEGTTVATYTAAGAVRRGLGEAGFHIDKRPGYGRKRECLHGHLVQRPTPTPATTPWDLPANAPAEGPAEAVIIGAGLAGCQLAAALAMRGTKVTVLEADAVAARASGNPQGVLFNRLSPQRSALADFSLHANLYAGTRYRQFFHEGTLQEHSDGALNGCLQTGPQASRISEEQLRELQSVAEHLSPGEAKSRLGSAPNAGGLWQPGSGWLSPPALCRALLDHPRITLKEGCGPLSFHRRNNTRGWTVVDGNSREIARTATLAIAAGVDTRHFTESKGLPLGTVRGQTTQIPASAGNPLMASYCHAGYVAPAVAGEHCIGATFQPKDEGRDLRVEDHRENLGRLAEAIPSWASRLNSLDPSSLSGRAELRCVSPDYLPLAGPVPDPEALGNCYAALARDASRCVADRAAYLPGLYISTAHGSRGLSYSALAAELIASQLWAEPLPVTREMQQALAPSRFMVRAIIRGTYDEKTPA